MSMDDEFEQIVSALPELQAMDNGTSLVVFYGDEEVTVSQVEFEGWVTHLVEHVCSIQEHWVDGLTPCLKEPQIVRFAVLREGYRRVGDIAFACTSSVFRPKLFDLMRKMAIYSRLEKPGLPQKPV